MRLCTQRMGKETCIEQMARTLRELQELRGLSYDEWVQEHLRWEDWGALRKQAEEFAARELQRRGRERGEVLPGGYDAESIAGQVIADMLEGKSRLQIGWTREQLVRELRRLILGKIRLLGMLKDASSVYRGVNGNCGIVPGERCGPAETGFEALARREEERRLEQVREWADGLLASEPVLADIFGCWWEGIEKPAEVGRRLGLEPAAVVKAGKRLGRRLVRWGAKGVLWTEPRMHTKGRK